MPIEVRLTALPGIVAPGSGMVAVPNLYVPNIPDTHDADVPVTILAVPAQMKRTGQETRLLIQGASSTIDREPDRNLLRLLAQARRFGAMVLHGQGKSVRTLAAEAGVSPSYFTRLFRLSLLAPEIVQAILHGRQPHGLTANTLRLTIMLAPAWSDQRRQLGFR